MTGRFLSKHDAARLEHDLDRLRENMDKDSIRQGSMPMPTLFLQAFRKLIEDRTHKSRLSKHMRAMLKAIEWGGENRSLSDMGIGERYELAMRLKATSDRILDEIRKYIMDYDLYNKPVGAVVTVDGVDFKKIGEGDKAVMCQDREDA